MFLTICSVGSTSLPDYIQEFCDNALNKNVYPYSVVYDFTVIIMSRVLVIKFL